MKKTKKLVQERLGMLKNIKKNFHINISMKKSLNLLCLLMLFVLTLQAQDKKVAVFDPVGSVPKSTKEIVREEISTIVVNTKGYKVLERSLIDKVLEENKFQMGGLVDESQISEIGKMMGANYALVTSITIMDNGSYYLSFKLIDVLTAGIEKQKTARTKSAELIDVVEKTVKEMFGIEVTPTVSSNTQTQNNQQPQPQSQSQSQQSSSSNIKSNGIYTSFSDLNIMATNKNMGDGITWDAAQGICARLNFGGFNDWYLPSKNELEMIFKLGDKNFKDGLSSFWYWSSTEIDDKKAYNISKGGWSSDEKKKNDGPGCICVRKINK